jgi:transcriptional regulator GlxA family with amidase domain
MSVPEEDTDEKIVRLGTETLFAIAEQLRRMYDADLRTKPSEKLERLMQRIERGEDVP